MPKMTPIIALHDAAIRIITEHKVFTLDLRSERMEEVVRKQHSNIMQMSRAKDKS